MARIVHWGKYYPPDMGGIESVTASLARGAAAAGHQVCVVCFDKREVPFEDQDGAVRVLRAPIKAFKASQPLGWRYLRTLWSEARLADVVHLHAPNMLSALAALLLPRRVKLLVHWHSDVIGKGLLHTLTKPIEWLMLCRADQIVCTSEPYARASRPLQRHRRKVRSIPLGVPDSMQRGRPLIDGSSLPPGLKSFIGEKAVILSVGRLVPYKGFSVLVRAARDLPSTSAVVIVGAGPLREQLQELIAATSVSDRVLLAGRLESDHLDTLMRGSTMFCLPSVERAEAFGVAIIEAMSYGLPIVATRIEGSGVPWVNQQDVSGTNVTPGDPASLAAACRVLLAEPTIRQRLARGSRLRFESEFSESTFVQRMLRAYDELLTAN